MHTYIRDLSNLENILDELETEDTTTFLDEKEETECVNSCLQLMHDYVHENPYAISEPDFEETMIENVKEIFELQLADFFYLSEDLDEDIDDLIYAALKLFYMHFIPPRSYPTTFSNQLDPKTISKLAEKIEYVKNKPQPEQRTPEWYAFRHNLITASNAYKAFESESARNQLIYEKCQPLKIETDEKAAQINIHSPFHWGQKFEPVSVLFYENKFGTKLGDYGCIQHDTYKFLGASPDGLNIDPLNSRYGRLIEIKNIVNREIDGIPKKEYWIQMQLQMETCGFNDCDFLECRFSEYESESAFYNDGTFSVSAINQELDQEPDDLKKGIIMYFSNKDGNPKYIYMPFHIQCKADFDNWEENMMEIHGKTLAWIKNIYWRLDEYSCVLVKRNQTWFQSVIGKLEETWNIIKKERESGFQHRASAKRATKKPLDLTSSSTINGCFLSIIKTNPITSIVTEPPILKIRTESFDETKKSM